VYLLLYISHQRRRRLFNVSIGLINLISILKISVKFDFIFAGYSVSSNSQTLSCVILAMKVIWQCLRSNTLHCLRMSGSIILLIFNKNLLVV
jgi:hypothetical protein